MRLIDADAIIIDLLDRGIEGVQADDYAEFQQIVADAPTVDAVPVVLCQDCKYWITGTENFCDLDGQNRKSYWFCADGERKGGGE